MRSIERRFARFEKKNPSLGSFYCLRDAVEDQHFSVNSLARAFSKFVPKEDYGRECRKELIAELVRFSNLPDEDKKGDFFVL